MTYILIYAFLKGLGAMPALYYLLSATDAVLVDLVCHLLRSHALCQNKRGQTHQIQTPIFNATNRQLSGAQASRVQLNWASKSPPAQRWPRESMQHCQENTPDCCTNTCHERRLAYLPSSEQAWQDSTVTSTTNQSKLSSQ